MLGLPDDDWASVAEWSDAMNQVVSVNVHEQLPRIEKAIGEVNSYMAAQIDRLRKQPDNSLGSRLVAAEEAEGRLTSDELIALFETLLIAGAESTRNQLSFGLYLFTKYSDQWESLAAEPHLAVSATEEVLRYRSHIVATARVAREDVAMHGFTIPKDTFVMVSLPSPNHDPTKYPKASEFDIRRFLSKDAKAQLSFGHGPHICIGAPLARVELQEAFSFLAQRMPKLRLDDTVPEPVCWNNPFGVHGPSPLHLRWDPANS
jgi:cytochrome P450